MSFLEKSESVAPVHDKGGSQPSRLSVFMSVVGPGLLKPHLGWSFLAVECQRFDAAVSFTRYLVPAVVRPLFLRYRARFHL